MSGSTSEESDGRPTWTDKRAEVFAVQERALHAARRAEHEQATALIREYIGRFDEAGIEPVPLKALPYRGSRPIRTSLTGWYLKTDHTIGVDLEGNYYILRVDGGVMNRLRGATPEPAQAPMVVGRGARDGETFELRELLEMRLTDPVRP